MAFAPYVTTSELKSWTTIADAIDDVEIDAIVVTATRWIDEYCQRNFWQDTAVARQFATTQAFCLALGPFNDLVSITSLKTDQDGDGVFETTWSASDYQLTPQNPANGRPYTHIDSVAGRLYPCMTSFVGRRTRIEVTGTWGWPAVPDTIKQACRIQASRLLGRRRSPEGVIGGTLGDFAQMRVSGRIDPDVEQLLVTYRHPSTSVLVA